MKDDHRRADRGSLGRGQTGLACLVVACGVVAQALPLVLHSWSFGPDQIEFISIGYNWSEGRGFVDPIRYSYYLPELQPPAPAAAIRPPIISVLIAIPLAAGLGLTGLGVVHVLWASLIGASSFLLARKFLNPSSALAFAIFLAWSPLWIYLSTQILTEVTAVGVLLAVIALANRGMSTTTNAVALALLTCLGWLVRPNLALIAPALAFATLQTMGVRGTLRSRPLWVYTATCAVIVAAIYAGHVVVHEVTPYAHYGVIETFGCEKGCDDVASFQKQYVGVFEFARNHVGEISDAIRSNFDAYLQHAFGLPFLFAGWIAIPGVVWAIFGREVTLSLRLAGWLSALLTANVVLLFAGFDPTRYPVLGLACGLLPGLVLFDRVARGGEGEPGGQTSRARRAIPLATAVLAFGLFAVPVMGASAARAWAAYREHGTSRIGVWMSGQPDSEWSADAIALCDSLHADARVASRDPYTLYMFCGNAGYRLPPDLTDESWVARYVDQQAVEFLVTDNERDRAILSRSPLLEDRLRRGRFSVFQVREPQMGSRPWQAPPPLVSLGNSAALRTGSR